jgi:co-chaperonin GroES (HSP10)
MVRGQLKPIRDTVLVADMNFDTRVTAGGIILNSDDGKTEGIRPRWGRVYAVGPEQTEVKLNEWVLVEHGRWTRGIEVENEDGSITTIRKIDNDCILAMADEQPSEF